MSSCPTLAKANASRRRAWKEMQHLRQLLESSGAPVEPVGKPPDFEKEGAALAAALSWMMLDYADRLNLLARSFTDLRCTVEHQQGEARYAGARAVMEYLLKTPRLPAAVVEEARKLSGFIGRDIDKITRDHGGTASL